ncbi:hypothetical protein JTE90_016340 [Oedothorax gibbosus]|uniref:Uncharacterized protein n=1 Tax=Oedothorax gibbosus TaxID=931172 RepID=A0AAV6THV3_9ARAC|nr:hypothetical protein JTE90_016340 [Oedothorax gibbosus]
MEPFPALVPKVHFSICYYHQDLHPGAAPGGLTPAPSTHGHRDPPTTAGPYPAAPILPDGVLALSEPLGKPPPEFPLASPLAPGYFPHLSGPNVCGSQNPPLPKWNAGGFPGAPAREGKGIPNAAHLRPAPYFHFAARGYSKTHCSRTCLNSLWAVFQDGSGG